MRTGFAIAGIVISLGCVDATVPVTPSRPAHAISYYPASSATILPGLGGSFNWVTDINENAHVVGASTLAPNVIHAVVWRNMVAEDLSPQAIVSMANGNNDIGQIVGFHDRSGRHRAVLWDNGIMSYLPELPASELSYAVDINNSGVIVGYSTQLIRETPSKAYGQRPIIWIGGIVSELPLPDGFETCQPFAISNTNHIAGACGDMDDSVGERAVVWHNNVVRVLPVSPNVLTSHAFGINDNGDPVGKIMLNTQNIDEHAAEWDAGRYLRDLGRLAPVGAYSKATAANKLGQVAGFIGTETSTRPSVWTWNSLRYLPVPPNEGPDAIANAINDRGEIAGQVFASDGTTKGVIWRPTPVY